MVEPSGLRRRIKAPFRKGASSNLVDIIYVFLFFVCIRDRCVSLITHHEVERPALRAFGVSSVKKRQKDVFFLTHTTQKKKKKKKKEERERERVKGGNYQVK